MTDPAAEDFGSGGIARFVEDPGVRLLILPSDPEASIVTFGGAFWRWWQEERSNPFEGATPTIWGNQFTPTVGAAVIYERNGQGRWNWSHYLALHRSGALEFVLGSLGVSEWQARSEERQERGFMLVTIVGRLWVTLERNVEVVTRFGLAGPWELTLALTRTEGAMLGNVAAGWKDLNGWWPGEAPRCPEPGLLVRREIDEWPDPDGRKRLAFEIGSVIEDAWGVKDRRFLAGEKQEGAGEFDVSRYHAG